MNRFPSQSLSGGLNDLRDLAAALVVRDFTPKPTPHRYGRWVARVGRCPQTLAGDGGGSGRRPTRGTQHAAERRVTQPKRIMQTHLDGNDLVGSVVRAIAVTGNAVAR